MNPEDIADELWQQEVRSRAVDIAARTLASTRGGDAHISAIFTLADLVVEYITEGRVTQHD
jgi:hypothetical protein